MAKLGVNIVNDVSWYLCYNRSLSHHLQGSKSQTWKVTRRDRITENTYQMSRWTPTVSITEKETLQSSYQPHFSWRTLWRTQSKANWTPPTFHIWVTRGVSVTGAKPLQGEHVINFQHSIRLEYSNIRPERQKKGPQPKKRLFSNSSSGARSPECVLCVLSLQRLFLFLRKFYPLDCWCRVWSVPLPVCPCSGRYTTTGSPINNSPSLSLHVNVDVQCTLLML